eukprot:1290351-Amphidinium_carterae.2
MGIEEVSNNAEIVFTSESQLMRRPQLQFENMNRTRRPFVESRAPGHARACCTRSLSCPGTCAAIHADYL